MEEDVRVFELRRVKNGWIILAGTPWDGMMNSPSRPRTAWVISDCENVSERVAQVLHDTTPNQKEDLTR